MTAIIVHICHGTWRAYQVFSFYNTAVVSLKAPLADHHTLLPKPSESFFSFFLLFAILFQSHYILCKYHIQERIKLNWNWYFTENSLWVPPVVGLFTPQGVKKPTTTRQTSHATDSVNAESHAREKPLLAGYSFSETTTIFLNRLKSNFNTCPIALKFWLWIEVCQNAVSSEITISSINKTLWNW